MHPSWKPRGPEWATLAPGVRWLIKPLLGEIQTAVSAKVAQAIGSLQEGRGLLEDLGFEPDEMGALGDLTVLAGLSSYIGAVYLADFLVTDWEGEGMTDPDTGEKIEVSPEAIRAAMRSGTPDGGSVLLEPFLAYVQRPAIPIAGDVRRLRELARWEHLGGGEHCRGCDELGAECAKGGTDDGDRCPRMVNAPRTEPGIGALASTRHAGAWHVGGMSGQLVGLNYATCLAIADAADVENQTYVDRGALVRCLQAIEGGALEASREKAKQGA